MNQYEVEVSLLIKQWAMFIYSDRKILSQYFHIFFVFFGPDFQHVELFKSLESSQEIIFWIRHPLVRLQAEAVPLYSVLDPDQLNRLKKMFAGK